MYGSHLTIKPSSLSLAGGVTLGIAIMLTGCGEDKATSFQIPKEKEAAPPPMLQPPTSVPSSGMAMPKVNWKLPAGWEEEKPGPMHVGNFHVHSPDGKQAIVTIIPLAGSAGGDVANVNRWRGQVGLGPLTGEELGKSMETVEIGNAKGTLFDMVGVPPEEKESVRILAAILPREGTTWFIKMTGADTLVQQQKPLFKEFLKSIAFEGETPTDTTVAATVPVVVTPEVTNSPTPAATATDPPWQVPAGWQSQPAGNMQTAKFAVPGQNNAKAEVTVSVFPGDVGGTFANVNRWRRQIELPPVDEAAVQKFTEPLDLGATKATLVDFTNEVTASRLIAAIVPQDNRTWFFKFVGDTATVGQQKEAFINFLKSFKPSTL